MQIPATVSFEMIRLQRQIFYMKSYNEQNYILYRGAFYKVYGFSNAKSPQ